jgi:hypothetical protein
MSKNRLERTKNPTNARSDILAVLLLKIHAFRHVTPRLLVNSYYQLTTSQQDVTSQKPQIFSNGHKNLKPRIRRQGRQHL